MTKLVDFDAQDFTPPRRRTGAAQEMVKAFANPVM